MNPIARFLAAFSPYRKAIGTLVGGVLLWAKTDLIPDGHVTRGEWYDLAIVFAVALGVYGVPNAFTAAQVATAVATQTSVETVADVPLGHPQSAANTAPDGWAGGADEEPT